MVNAYTIGVTIFLRNQMARGLRGLSQQVRGAAGDVNRLQRQIETLQLLMRARLVPQNVGQAQLQALNAQLAIANNRAGRLTANLHAVNRLTTIGGTMTAAGIGGFMLFGRAAKRGEDYMGRINQLRLAGLTETEVNDAVATSWKTTSEVITTSVKDNIAALLDLRNVIGKLDVAQMVLPKMQKAEAIMRAAGMGEKAKDQSFDAVKVIDMMNKGLNENDIGRNLESMLKVAQVTGNRITPESFRMNLKYARQARGILSEDFIYGVMPTLMLDLLGKGGGSGSHGGLGPMLAAMHKIFVQGVMGKGTATRLRSLGAFDDRALIRDMGKSKTLVNLGFKGNNLARVMGGTAGRKYASDPYKLVHEWFLPLIYKKHGMVGDEQLKELINFYLAGAPQTAIDLVQQLATRREAIERDRALYPKAMGMEEAYQQSLSGNPATARQALAAQWDNLNVALTERVLPHLLPLLIKTAEGFNTLALKMREYPDLTEKAGIAWLTITGLLTATGPVLLAAAAWRLLTGAAIGPSIVSGISTLVGGAGAGLTGLAAVLGLPAWATLAVVASGLAAIAAAIQTFTMNPDARARMGDYFGGGDPLQAAFGGRSAATIPPRSSRPIVLTSNVVVDGRVAATAVSRHLGPILDRPANSSSVVDNRMGYALSNLSQ